MKETMRTLLTGFGPFGAVADNPTERLAAHFAAAGAPGHDLITLVLPVSHRRAPGMLRAALEREGPFERVLMLGVAAGAAAWRVECVGRNWRAGGPDADGFAPGEGALTPEGPAELPATADPRAAAVALDLAGLPHVLSQNAGGYLCNTAYFTALEALRGSAARALFLHVPADPITMATGRSAPQFTFEQHIAAVTAVLDALRGEAQGREAADSAAGALPAGVGPRE